jgi:hypothetical protein
MMGTWSADEDSRLREAVADYGTSWVPVARHVRTRNGDQCAKRWRENLDPALNHSPWTAEEVRPTVPAHPTAGKCTQADPQYTG